MLTEEQKNYYEHCKRELQIPSGDRTQSDKKIIDYCNAWADKLKAWLKLNPPGSRPSLIYYRTVALVELGLSPAGHDLCVKHSLQYNDALKQCDQYQEAELLDYATNKARKGNALISMFAMKNLLPDRWRSDKQIDAAAQRKPTNQSYTDQLGDN